MPSAPRTTILALSPEPMRFPRSCAVAATSLASLVLLTGCVSDFEFELPDEHPARPTATPAGPLPIPSPFDIAPPQEPAADGADTMREMPTEGDGSGAESTTKPELQRAEKEGR